MINLLSLKEKNKRKQEKQIKLICIWFVLIASFLISLILILLIVKIYIKEQVNSEQQLIQREEARSVQVKELEGKIKIVNDSFSYLNDFYKTRFSFISLNLLISEFIPETLSLESFSWQETDMRITMVGYGPNLEEIYKFRETLKQEQIFDRVSFNIPDWFGEEKIRFQALFFLENKK